MKQLSIFMAMAAVAMGFTSCEEDKEPVYQEPTQFVLNTPAMEDQYIELGDNGTLELVASQPDYGYSAVANYSAEMSLSEDFGNYVEIIPTDAHQARMTFKQMDVALALCELLGIDGEDSFKEKYPDGMPYMQIYFRGVCQLEGVESSLIRSNVVSYKNIKGYLAVQTAGYIYLVGDPNGWNINAGPEWRLYEQVIGSKIYSGVFHVDPGQYFRFYTEIGDWGNDGQLPSIGANPVDGDSNMVEWVDGSFTAPAVAGKGSWYMPNDWTGQDVTMVVNLSDDSNWTVTFYEGSVEVVPTTYIYLMGSVPGWTEPSDAQADFYNNWRLACADGTGIYTGTFDFPAGDNYLRFATELTADGWDNTTQIGPFADDGNNLNCEFVNNVFNGTYVSGKGCWVISLNDAAKVSLTVDTNGETVNFVIE